MTSSKTDIAKVVAMIAASYSTWQATKERTTVFYEMLRDLDPNHLHAAAAAWVMTEKWPPTIADLRNACCEMSGQLAPTPDQAWAEILAAVRDYGYRRRPEWSHPAIEAAVAGVGWSEICLTTNIETTRAHFLRGYEHSRTRENRQAAISPQLKAILGGKSNHILKPLDEDNLTRVEWVSQVALPTETGAASR